MYFFSKKVSLNRCSMLLQKTKTKPFEKRPKKPWIRWDVFAMITKKLQKFNSLHLVIDKSDRFITSLLMIFDVCCIVNPKISPLFG